VIDCDRKINLPLDTDNEDQLLLSGNIERAVLLSQTGKADLFTLLVAVLLDVLLGTFEDYAALLLLSLEEDVSCEAWVGSKINRRHLQ